MSAERNEAKPTVRRLDRIGLLNLLIVILVGSTTFLAIRVAVGSDGGFPPLGLGAIRCAAAASALGLWLWLRGGHVDASRRAVLGALASGAMLWGGANGLSAIASRSVGSGIVAMFFATGSLWVTLFDAFLRRRWPALRDLTAMALGTTGLLVLTAPSAKAIPTDPLLILALLLAPLFFALGILTMRQFASSLGGVRTAALQMTAGMAVLGLLAVLAGEPLPAPTPLGWMMYGWLTLGGSVIGFTAFAVALARLPTTVFLSHAWVNPILATVLGVVALGEPVTGGSLIAAALVLLGLKVAMSRR